MKNILIFLFILMTISTIPSTVKNETIGSTSQPGVLTTISGTDVRMIQGYYPGDSVLNAPPFLGVKVSKPGIDVRTADNEDLIFSSAFNNFKILKSGYVTVIPSQVGSTDEALGAETVTYEGDVPRPFVMAFWGGTLISDELMPFPFTLFSKTTSPTWSASMVVEGNIYLQGENEIRFVVNGKRSMCEGVDFFIYYYIFVDTAQVPIA